MDYFADIQKMRADRDELEIKINKALAFMNTDTFKSLTTIEKSMLHSQVHVMQAYYEILNTRIIFYKE